MKVTIRKKKLKDDKSSLYLDITSEGQRKKEYLKLIIHEKPKNEMERSQNKETMKIAEAVKAKKLVELMEGHFGFNRNKQKKVKFMDYFKGAVERRKNSEGNYGNWNSVYKHLKSYSKSDVYLDEVDEKWLSEFKFYLQHLAKKGTETRFLPILHPPIIIKWWPLYDRHIQRMIFNAIHQIK